jgi:hypothetical protein
VTVALVQHSVSGGPGCSGAIAAGNRVHSQPGRPALDGRQLQRADVALHPDPAAGVPGKRAAGTHSCRIAGPHTYALAHIPLTTVAIVNPALAFLPESAADSAPSFCPRRPTRVCTPERPVPEGVSAALAVRSIPVAARPGGSNWRPERIIVRFVRHRPSARCQRAAVASPLGCHDGSRDTPGGRDLRVIRRELVVCPGLHRRPRPVARRTARTSR